MKRTTIKRIVEQELKEAVEQKLLEAPEITSAARKARALGLKYMGFGRWTDDSPGRPVVARTSGGGLRFEKGFNPKVHGKGAVDLGKNKTPQSFISHPDIKSAIKATKRREQGAAPQPTSADLEFFRKLIGHDESKARIQKVHNFLAKKSDEQSSTKPGIPPQERWKTWLRQYETQFRLKPSALKTPDTFEKTAKSAHHALPKGEKKAEKSEKNESVVKESTANTSAISKTKSWVNTIRNPDKKKFAEAYALYLINGSRGECPSGKEFDISKYMEERVKENLEKHYYARYAVDEL